MHDSRPEKHELTDENENAENAMNSSKKARITHDITLTNDKLRARTTIIVPGMNVFLRLPSGMMKLVTLEKGKIVSIGKFGNFDANSIIGKPFGPTYEIRPDGTLEIMHQAVAKALGKYTDCSHNTLS